MISSPNTIPRQGLAPADNLTPVQHNSLRSWDVFLSLFSSLTEGPPPDMVLLQDPPSSKGFLPSFSGFKSFAPPVGRPRVACYISTNFLRRFAELPSFPPETADFISLEVSTPQGCFGTTSSRFTIGKAYARPLTPLPHSVSPESSLPDLNHPYLVAGDFNIHNAAANPFRLLSSKEERESARYFDRASELAFTLLNTPAVYTRFPFWGNHRPSTIDLAFANPQMFPAFRSWGASSLLSTGSDHTPIIITLRPPSPYNDKPRPRWEEADWPGLTDKLKNWLVPPPPGTPSPNQLNQCFSSALAALTTMIETTAPRSRPSPRSKARWTPLLTTLRKEFTKATRKAKKTQTPNSYNIARQSKLAYFKAIKREKAIYWADFLAKTSPNNIWTAKQLVAPRKTPRFPSLPDASDPVAINKAVLDPFFPPKDPLPNRGRLKKNPSATPLTKEEIELALSKSSPSSAPGPDGIAYSVWRKVNLINPAILLELHAPLVAFGYHPPSLITANEVVLDKPGKASYDCPASLRVILLLKTVSKVLERVMTVRLSAVARSKGRLYPNQCGSLPGLSSSDACLTLMHEVKTLQRPKLEVSTLFLDIKAGFDNVNTSTLRARLLASHIPSYMVDWVSSFLSERTCTLVFQGSPNVSSPVSVGTPQGSPISPLLFLLYVSPLHMSIPRGLMVSYVDDFSITVSSPSYRGNIRRLQKLFSTIARKGRDSGVSFSVPKTELIHWRTPSQRTPPSHAPIGLEGHLFRPSQVVRWLGYWFTPSFNMAHHYRHRLSLAQGIFSFGKRPSSPGAGVRPFLCHRIANGLLLPILT